MPYQFEVAPEKYLKGDVSQYPAGMRNNNPGNLKYSGSKWQQSHYPGMLGPSVNTDEGAHQIVFSSPQKGMEAMSRLLVGKYDSGLDTPRKLITDHANGWTPGNPNAAVNIAAGMGIGQDDKVNLRDPQQLASLQRALITQEHGQKGAEYHPLVDAAVSTALGGAPVQPSTLSADASAPAATGGKAASPDIPAGAPVGLLGGTPGQGTSFDELSQGFQEANADPVEEPAAEPKAPEAAPQRQASADDGDSGGGGGQSNWQEQGIGKNAYQDKLAAQQGSRRGLLGQGDALNNGDILTMLMSNPAALRGLLG